jgi:hypothetical protein
VNLLARRPAIHSVKQRAPNKLFDAPDEIQRTQGEIVPKSWKFGSKLTGERAGPSPSFVTSKVIRQQGIGAARFHAELSFECSLLYRRGDCSGAKPQVSAWRSPPPPSAGVRSHWWSKIGLSRRMSETPNKSEEQNAEAEVEHFRRDLGPFVVAAQTILEAVVHLDYRADGLVCTIDIPAPQAVCDG